MYVQRELTSDCISFYLLNDEAREFFSANRVIYRTFDTQVKTALH